MAAFSEPAEKSSREREVLVLFSFKHFCKIDIVQLSFIFDKYYSNMD